MATTIGNGVQGDAQNTQVSSLAFTLPTGLQAGDRLIVFVNSSDSAMVLGTLPSGTTIKDQRANGTNQNTAVLEKILGAGDSGATYTVPWTSASARATLQWSVWRGTSGTSTVAFGQDPSAVGTFTIPTVTGVAAGSVQIGATLRRRSGASANTTNSPAGWTPGTETRTAYGTGVNVFGQSAYIASSAGGSVGGDSFTTGGVTSLGTNYHVILPPAVTLLSKFRYAAGLISKLFFNSAEVQKVYLGTTQLWP